MASDSNVNTNNVVTSNYDLFHNNVVVSDSNVITYNDVTFNKDVASDNNVNTINDVTSNKDDFMIELVFSALYF